MNYEEVIMQLILHGGNARGLAYEALDEAEEHKFDVADKLLEEAQQEFNEAHQYQTKLIQNQSEDMIPTFVMIHAQDHVMTAQAELQLIKRMVRQYQHQEKLEKRMEQLESK